MVAVRNSIDQKRFSQDRDAFMKYYRHDKEPSGEIGHEDEVDADCLGSPTKKKRTLLL